MDNMDDIDIMDNMDDMLDYMTFMVYIVEKKLKLQPPSLQDLLTFKNILLQISCSGISSIYIVPISIFSILYNVPKFFELRMDYKCKSRNSCSEMHCLNESSQFINSSYNYTSTDCYQEEKSYYIEVGKHQGSCV